MGVSLQTYRLRIGTFNSSFYGTTGTSSKGTSDGPTFKFRKLSILLLLFLFLIVPIRLEPLVLRIGHGGAPAVSVSLSFVRASL